MPEGVADSRLAIPFQTVQEITDRMERVPVGHDVDCFLDQILGSDPVGPFTVQMNVVKVVVSEPGSAPTFPSEILYDIDPLRQLVVADGPAKERVIGQDRFGVCDAVFHLTFLRRFQKIPHILRRHLRL